MPRLRGIALGAASLVVLAVSTSTQAITADDYDPNNFDRSTIIDNEWLPLRPGTVLTYKGWTEKRGRRIPHRVVFTVTDLTKVIDGVRAVAVWDRDYSAGNLLESELVFFAQDIQGNVWHLGQYRETYDRDGEFVGGRAWLVGHLEGARAGIMMKADPQVGTPSYSEGYAPPPFFWDDWARVFRMGVRTCVPFGCFEGVLVTDEFEPTKKGAHQLKYYARGVGVVRVGWMGKDDEKEILKLVEVRNLSGGELVEMHAEALKLETRAYVYGLTPPVENGPGADE